MGKPAMWLLIRRDSNRAVQAREMARGWMFLRSSSASLVSHMQFEGFSMSRLISLTANIVLFKGRRRNELLELSYTKKT